MDIIRIVLTGFVFSWLLAGCASLTPQAQPENHNQAWDSRVQSLSGIENWDLKGLIAIRSASRDAFSADWQWQQQSGHYSISMVGPLGSNAIKLTGQPNHVLLETSDGKHFNASSPEMLLEQQIGWRVPVSNLYYWVRGLPVPGMGAHKEFDSYNHLTLLIQDSWRIQYLRYTSINHIDVPNKIFINNPQLDIKIIINHWQI